MRSNRIGIFLASALASAAALAAAPALAQTPYDGLWNVTVVTKNGSYEGGCSGSSCLYKPMKKKTPKHHKAS